MRYWDSSAVVPLLAAEARSERLEHLHALDPEMFVWWGTEIECTAAIARFEREKVLTSGGVAQAIERLGAMRDSWSEVPAHDTVRQIARRIVRVHPLRAADALQLAAAVVASENRPETLELVSLDARLTQAALREGFAVTEIV